jgi:hypothetical protein
MSFCKTEEGSRRGKGILRDAFHDERIFKVET